MNNVTFAITMIVVGMGGTIFTLGLIAAIISGLERLFPEHPPVHPPRPPQP